MLQNQLSQAAKSEYMIPLGGPVKHFPLVLCEYSGDSSCATRTRLARRLGLAPLREPRLRNWKYHTSDGKCQSAKFPNIEVVARVDQHIFRKCAYEV